MSVSYGGSSITFEDGSVNSSGFIGHRNRIINGAMVIDQRNAGASVTVPATTNTYIVDRFLIYTAGASKVSGQQSTTASAGFSNSLLITSLAATTPSSGDLYMFRQGIEGYNIADFNWGSANAKTVTLSFWVRSSVTGTYGGCFTNADVNRAYPFSYTVSSANTWEQKTITLTGDTSGTWNTTNGTGIRLYFSLGSGSSFNGTAGAWATVSDVVFPTGSQSLIGTNGATFYITGVQLERGSTASSFEYRSYGAELVLCQRYFQSVGTTADVAYGSSGTAPMRINAVNNGGTQPLTGWQYPVAMRATPSIQTYGAGVAGGNFVTNDSGAGSATQTSFGSTDIGFKGCRINLNGRSNSAYQYWVDCGTGSGQLGWTQSAEL
jgi:hypothetical protein